MRKAELPAVLAILACFLSFGRQVSAEKDTKKGQNIEVLINRMIDAKASWKDRCAAEDALRELPPEQVLPRLLREAAKKMPSGGIWNSAGREHDKAAPVRWQVWYAVGRTWSALARRLSLETGAEFLVRLLDSALEPAEKNLLVTELQVHWSPRAEQPLAGILRARDAPVDLRLSAAYALVNHGKQSYQEAILGLAARANHQDKIRYCELLASRPSKKRTGIDPRVLVLGFELMQQEDDRYRQEVAKSPDAFHGGYFVACRMADYVGEKFAPDFNDPRYNNSGRRDPRWFADTVARGLQWWKKNRQRFTND